MIHWLIQTTAAHPDLARGQASPGLLSAEETALFNGFKLLKRRQDWLLGRWTAKHLLQEVFRQEKGQPVALDSITILPGADGAPAARFDSPFNDRDLPITVSISHSHGSSLCAAVTRAEWPLGADIERIESRAANFAASFFTEEEQALIRRATPEMQDTLVTAVWSAKEAALKAIHEGLRVDTRSVNCQLELPTELPAVWKPFVIQWKRNPSPGDPPQFRGWWMVTGHYVLTLVAGDDQESQVIEKTSNAGT